MQVGESCAPTGRHGSRCAHASCARADANAAEHSAPLSCAGPAPTSTCRSTPTKKVYSPSLFITSLSLSVAPKSTMPSLPLLTLLAFSLAAQNPSPRTSTWMRYGGHAHLVITLCVVYHDARSRFRRGSLQQCRAFGQTCQWARLRVHTCDHRLESK